MDTNTMDINVRELRRNALELQRKGNNIFKNKGSRRILKGRVFGLNSRSC